MPTNDVSNRLPLSAWQSQGLRLTAFPSPDTQVSGHDWWVKVVGEPPERITSQPRTGEQLTEGLFENGRLVLSIHPLRIDWRWDAVEEISTEQSRMPSIGGFLPTVQTFRDLANRWLTLETTPPLARLAFGAVLLQAVDNRAEAYKLLSAYLPFQIEFEDTSDFLYQINRRRDSITQATLKINRLSKWSAALFGMMQYSLSVGVNPALVGEAPPGYAARLELDVNTVPEDERTLEPNNLPELFNELITLGTEIAERGDIP